MIALKLDEKFGKISYVYYVSYHYCLDMKSKFNNLKVRVDVWEFLKKAVEMFGEANLTPVTLQSKKNLQCINPDSLKRAKPKGTIPQHLNAANACAASRKKESATSHIIFLGRSFFSYYKTISNLGGSKYALQTRQIKSFI